MARLVNLTSHEISFLDSADAEPWLVLPSEGQARASERREYIDNLLIGDIKVPVNKVVLGNTTGLPEPQSGVVYVVSRLIAEAHPERGDLFFVDETVRDGQGRIVGCKSLTKVAARFLYLAEREREFDEEQWEAREREREKNYPSAYFSEEKVKARKLAEQERALREIEQIKKAEREGK